MNLDDTQRKQVSQWIAEGLKLSEIQSRLASELGVRLTYMDVRLLVDDLKLTPKDVEPAKSIPSVLAGPGAPPTAGTRAPAARPGTEASKPASPGGLSPGISLAVDQIGCSRNHPVTARQRRICNSSKRRCRPN